MNLKISLLHAAILSTVFTANCSYANSPVIGQSFNAEATEAYWTPERMRDAIPFPMPIISAKDIQEVPASALPSSEKNVFADGVGPSSPVKPDLRQIFTPKKTLNGSVLKDKGNANQDYSSSSLVPETADLSYPYSAVGKLYFLNNGVGYVCSASVIGPRVVITAAHCVHSGKNGANGFYKSFRFVPASRNGAAPYGSWGATFAIAPATWMAGGPNGTGNPIPNEADHALLEMADATINGKTQTLGATVGVLGYQLQSLVPNHAHILGYPCNLDSCNKMHQITAQSAKAVLPNDGEYGSDMLGGASGGPWIQNFGIKSAGQLDGKNPGFNRLLGVSSYARVDDRSIGASNLGTIFTALLNTVCARKAGNCTAATASQQG